MLIVISCLPHSVIQQLYHLNINNRVKINCLYTRFKKALKVGCNCKTENKYGVHAGDDSCQKNMATDG